MSSRASIDQFLRRVESGEYFARLVNHPAPHRLRTAPQIVYHSTLHDLAPRLTVVTPTFNYAPIIRDCIDATAAAASLPFDWIIVDDGSEDGTAERARAIFESIRCPLVARATIVRNPVPIFETACDNIGFTLAETDAIVEIQGDIQVREPAYDALLLRMLASHPTPSAVSGRCGHTFMHLRRSSLGRWLEPATHFVGLCGRTIDAPERVHAIKGKVYRCETVNRGPWALRKTDVDRHGYLDERYFFLGNDDHDYHRRLFESEGRRPLYLPMSIRSPRRLGASRRTRKGDNRVVFDMLKREKTGSPAFHAFLESLTSCSPPEEVTVSSTSP
jgi:glycosyltransferase involved in cell wall biosynthesis